MLLACAVMVFYKCRCLYTRFNLQTVLVAFYITFSYKLTDIFFTVPGILVAKFNTNYSFLPTAMQYRCEHDEGGIYSWRCDLLKLAIRVLESIFNILLFYRFIRAIETEDVQYCEAKSLKGDETKAHIMRSPTGSKFRYWLAGKTGNKNMEQAVAYKNLKVKNKFRKLETNKSISDGMLQSIMTDSMVK